MRIHRLWLLVVAAIVALLGSSGRAQPPMESLLGREVPPVVGMTGQPFVATCMIDQEDSFDFHGVQFFTLACGSAQGRAVLSIDGDLLLSVWLHAHLHQRIPVTLGHTK